MNEEIMEPITEPEEEAQTPAQEPEEPQGGPEEALPGAQAPDGDESLPDGAQLRRIAEAAARLTLLRQQQWEAAAGEDLLLARAIRSAHPGADTQEILSGLNRQRDEQAAQRLNMTSEELEQLRDSLRTRRDSERARSDFARELLRQEEDVRRNLPDFDLAGTISASPAFRALILAGEPVEKALAYLNPEQYARLAESRVAERIRKRCARAQPLSAAGRPHTPVTVDTMTEAELRRIDDKLKRGEHVKI